MPVPNLTTVTPQILSTVTPSSITALGTNLGTLGWTINLRRFPDNVVIQSSLGYSILNPTDILITVATTGLVGGIEYYFEIDGVWFSGALQRMTATAPPPPLTAPYGQHHYIGEHDDDTSALDFIQQNKWDTDGDGTGNPQKGMMYYNKTVDEMFFWNGTGWIPTGEAMLDGAGSPNGAVIGYYGQRYYDTTNQIIYMCVSDPTGTAWRVT